MNAKHEFFFRNCGFLGASFLELCWWYCLSAVNWSLFWKTWSLFKFQLDTFVSPNWSIFWVSIGHLFWVSIGHLFQTQLITFLNLKWSLNKLQRLHPQSSDWNSLFLRPKVRLFIGQGSCLQMAQIRVCITQNSFVLSIKFVILLKT